jgi:ABC-2 type transport system permease protein
MRGAFVIAGKDLRNFFLSPLFYILGGICSLVWSVLLIIMVGEFVQSSSMRMMQAQMSGQQEQGLPLHLIVVRNHFQLVNLFMIFVVAAITMRLFTEEKRQRTYDLLLTAPVTATEIAVGKLIAGVATTWALLAIAAFLPMTLGFYGQLDWGPMASSLIGLALLTAAYVAIGMFASSITQSTAVAVILALVFNVTLWFIGALADASGNPTERAIFEHLNVGSHLQVFTMGSFTIAGFVYLASVVFLFTFLTQRVVESSRWR